MNDLAAISIASCHCGQSIPAGFVAYCSRPCRWADDDHGPETEPTGDDQ